MAILINNSAIIEQLQRAVAPKKSNQERPERTKERHGCCYGYDCNCTGLGA